MTFSYFIGDLTKIFIIDYSNMLFIMRSNIGNKKSMKKQAFWSFPTWFKFLKKANFFTLSLLQSYLWNLKLNVASGNNEQNLKQHLLISFICITHTILRFRKIRSKTMQKYQMIFRRFLKLKDWSNMLSLNSITSSEVDPPHPND